MKLLLCVLGMSFLLFGCDSGTPGKNSSASPDAESSVRKAVNDTADYVTGAKQVKVQKTSTRRVNDLNQKHNAELEKALED